MFICNSYYKGLAILVLQGTIFGNDINIYSKTYIIYHTSATKADFGQKHVDSDMTHNR